MLGFCKNGRVTQFQNTLFPEKFEKSFEAYPLKIGTIYWPPFVLSPFYPRIPELRKHDTNNIHDGIEIRLVNMITEKLNITPLYIMCGVGKNYGKIYSKTNMTGILYNLSAYDIDMAIGNIHLKPLKYDTFDIVPANILVSFNI